MYPTSCEHITWSQPSTQFQPNISRSIQSTLPWHSRHGPLKLQQQATPPNVGTVLHCPLLAWKARRLGISHHPGTAMITWSLLNNCRNSWETSLKCRCFSVVEVQVAQTLPIWQYGNWNHFHGSFQKQKPSFGFRLLPCALGIQSPSENGIGTQIQCWGGDWTP